MRSYKSISGDNNKNYEGLDITIIYENDGLLIDLIKGYPHLYDKSLKNYKDQLIKEKSWLEISEIMQLSVNQCQVRWTRLREKYSKERKQRQNETRSGSGISNRVVWPLYDNMKFFEKHIAKRNTYSNLSQETNNKENILNCSQNILSFESSQNSSTASAVISPPDSITSTLNGNQQHSLFSATNPCIRKSMSTLQQPCTSIATTTSIEIPATIERLEERRPSMSSITSSHGSTTQTLSETNANRDKCFTPIKKQRISQSDKIEETLLSLTTQLSDKINNSSHLVTKSRIENIKDVDDKFADFIAAELQNMPQELRKKKKKQIIDILWTTET
ncbi:Aminopeptidase n [Camponotus japonicus]